MKKRKPSQEAKTAVAIEALLQATIELVAERGLDGFAIADVAQRAGVSRGLPGHHFKTKDTLMLEAAKLVLVRTEALQEPGLQALLSWLDHKLQTMRPPTPNSCALTVLLTSVGTAPDLYREIEAWRTGVADFVTTCLAQGINDGSVRPSVNPGVAGKVLVANLIGLLTRGATGGLSESEVREFISTVEAGFEHRPQAAQDRPSNRAKRGLKPKPTIPDAAPTLPGMFD